MPLLNNFSANSPNFLGSATNSMSTMGTAPNMPGQPGQMPQQSNMMAAIGGGNRLPIIPQQFMAPPSGFMSSYNQGPGQMGGFMQSPMTGGGAVGSNVGQLPPNIKYSPYYL